MRRLDGQVHSYDSANDVGIVPGSRTVSKAEMQNIHRDLIRGLCLLEGCIPTTHLNPAMHHFVHYTQYTVSHGPLRNFWMMMFERYNKHIKGLCRNPECPEVSLSRSLSNDVSARFLNMAEVSRRKFDVSKDHHHLCSLSSKWGKFIPTPNSLRICVFSVVTLDVCPSLLST